MNHVFDSCSKAGRLDRAAPAILTIEDYLNLLHIGKYFTLVVTKDVFALILRDEIAWADGNLTPAARGIHNIGGDGVA